MEDKLKELEYAKKAVISCLKYNVFVDMHNLTYWADKVERLRKEILENL